MSDEQDRLVKELRMKVGALEKHTELQNLAIGYIFTLLRANPEARANIDEVLDELEQAAHSPMQQAMAQVARKLMGTDLPHTGKQILMEMEAGREAERPTGAV